MLVPKPLRTARVTVEIGEGEFECELRLGELEALQSKIGLGPEKILERIQNREWFTDEVRQIIRLGLIGGGMSQTEALALINRNIVPGYLLEYIPVAMTILYAALIGVEDDPPGESMAVTEPETTEMSEGSGNSPSSTD